MPYMIKDLVYQFGARNQSIPDKYFVERGLREAVVLQQLLGSTILKVSAQAMKNMEYFFEIEGESLWNKESSAFTHRQR